MDGDPGLGEVLRRSDLRWFFERYELVRPLFWQVDLAMEEVLMHRGAETTHPAQVRRVALLGPALALLMAVGCRLHCGSPRGDRRQVEHRRQRRWCLGEPNRRL